MKYIYGFLLCLFVLSSASAQQFGFGIKAGLSFSTFSGDLLEGEEYGYKSGFHVGPSFSLKFNDVLSVRAEVLYNQLGGEYAYQGPSYFVFRTANGRADVFSGEKDMNLTSFLNYFDIPIQVGVRINNAIEVFGGINVLILPGATGGGVVDFTDGRDSLQNVTLDYSYNGDDATKGGGDSDLNDIRFNRTGYILPSSLGAYYDFEEDEKDGRAFNTFDFGVHAGVRVFFNDALYLAGRVYYGLTDVTNNDLDLQQRREQGQDLLELSDDEDRNFSIQMSLGFTF